MEISTILPQYTQLNSIIGNIVRQNHILFDEQKFVTGFYNQFNDNESFETMLIELMMQADTERRQILMQSLSTEIQHTIQIISGSKETLEKMDIERACHTFANQYNKEITNQLHITQHISKELNETNGSLDAIGFRQHTEQEEKRLWDKHETLSERYTTEKKRLNELYEKQKTAEKISVKYLKNQFLPILFLSQKFSKILEKYILKESDNLQNGTFFDMATASAIYKICNDTIFEKLSETDFYTAINLLSSDKRLRLKPKQKTRACFLIYKLYESIKSDNKTQWRVSILQHLDIDENYYKSKYKDPISEVPSRKSEKFANEIIEVFK